MGWYTSCFADEIRTVSLMIMMAWCKDQLPVYLGNKFSNVPKIRHYWD